MAALGIPNYEGNSCILEVPFSRRSNGFRLCGLLKPHSGPVIG